MKSIVDLHVYLRVRSCTYAAQADCCAVDVSGAYTKCEPHATGSPEVYKRRRKKAFAGRLRLLTIRHLAMQDYGFEHRTLYAQRRGPRDDDPKPRAQRREPKDENQKTRAQRRGPKDEGPRRLPRGDHPVTSVVYLGLWDIAYGIMVTCNYLGQNAFVWLSLVFRYRCKHFEVASDS